MSTVTVVAIAVPVLVVAAALLLFASARRQDTDRATRFGGTTGKMSRETAKRDRGPLAPPLEEVWPPEEPPLTGRDVERAAALARRGEGAVATVPEDKPVAWVPPDEETLGITRRQFFNRSIVTMFAFGTGAFGAASLVFIWPGESEGFGSEINLGSLEDLKTEIRDNNNFLFKPEGQMWVTEYPQDAVSKAEAVYSEPELAGMREGIVALWQKCPHLGCRVPECLTSQWFECPCHGSQYNQVGEKKGGPAPRGMDRFPVTVNGGSVTVDTGTVILGPAIGTNTTGQEAEGPNCVSGGGEA